MLTKEQRDRKVAAARKQLDRTTEQLTKARKRVAELEARQRADARALTWLGEAPVIGEDLTPRAADETPDPGPGE